MIRWFRRATAIGALTLAVSACEFNGLNSVNMPGTAGHGEGSFTIYVELPDVAALPQNSPVKVDDVTVGSVSGVKPVQRADGTFFALVQVSLDGSVRLPENATATVAQTSLLGSRHLELAAPETRPPIGRLGPGSRIGIDNAGNYPSTEDVLSSLALVVNNGNLGVLQDITDEIYAAVAGRAGRFAAFLPRLAELTAAIDAQANDIVTAMDNVNRFAGQLAGGADKIERALVTLPAATRVLKDNGDEIVAAFAALGRLADTAAPLLAQTKEDLAADLVHAYALIKAANDNADTIVDALPILPAFPLPLNEGLKRAVRGDFLNVYATFDLTLRRIGENFFTTSALDPNMKHLSEIVSIPDYLIGATSSLSGQAADPFTIPPHNSSDTPGQR
ncbi:MCE family protein [Mycolicibacterium thermoresistibile]|uniref:Virulence factor Mce family protein n=2 Tax=Mycolicibacterium thermoresistibile TaxID=1797 RepID=G7CFW9_MYCT3|nr:MCE family protein [Mycolicibacterium thermoresistibile]EHI13398.1 virulence factor Mce family protein [Mycolicibacterium thermoresistibile ATCC 19527]MCV7189190.1 MCE family protein [Mycolicibacterium thermoresistibile]GAT14620.1 MCE-family lipoprotein LprN [Mycolicibacterium thermoresistibile]SNW19847.1 MCE-family lipoprotein LprN [Mycolicibacterium thermoresistibile]